MKREINIFWYLVPIAVVLLGSLIAEGLLRAALVGGGLFAIGIACLVNFRRCGRMHCAITGPILLVLSVLVFLAFFDVFVISDSILNATLIGGLLAGFGVEYLYRRKYGTCYVKHDLSATKKYE